MAHLLTDSDLNGELEHLIRSAEEELILISPYIKLHDRIKSILKVKKDEPNVKITIVFGKNEDNISSSINRDDITFFKSLPNIELRHEKRLHAKYYCSEKSAIATSMNLYDFSQNNNIEFGIIAKMETLDTLKLMVTRSANLSVQIYIHIDEIVKGSTLLFRKTPDFEKSKIPFKKDKYLGSTVEIDMVESMFKKKKEDKPQQPKPQQGYCIRTGVKIPFNPKKPMTLEAYKSWERYKNADYKEKFCHKTGKPSGGKTSMRNPIFYNP